ncbi:hypothetical protein M9458_008425, partial [Cirrhinus mrigala]
ACDLTLDPNTALDTQLILSDENRKITGVEDNQLVESLTGRCYWEAEWSGNEAEISVSYKGIRRKGGSNKSWSLVGVYVDVSAGSLSFYSVSDTHTLTHLHTFNTTFTEPLYAGFGVYGSVSLCDIKQPPVRIISDPHVT